MRVGPGRTIGIIGSGQLGRMLALAAAPLGYKVLVYAPDRGCAAAVAAGFTVGAFDDEAALSRFAAGVDVVTYEFENLPVAPLEALGEKLRPGTRSLAIAQDRAVEKRFIEGAGANVSPWRSIDSLKDVECAISELGLPLVLKSRRLGYDGKGQAWIHEGQGGAPAWDSIGRQPAVAEAAVDYLAEFSVVLARTADGASAHWEVPRNGHDGGILRRSEVPANLPDGAGVEQAIASAHAIAKALDHVGVMTVEFFATADGPIVNEIAPRVHNSGHWTIEGAVTSQFEQHIRAVCGLPLGQTALRATRVTMDNLIGEEIGQWATLIEEPGAHVHDYDKGDARPGRKMGHVTRVIR
ncbi:MAG: 5-(carboxyamino)imidazole ribonucleotide synthase [Pseudomonadota bacterium]|nr:5-(carboxyamino)imidazole ribonucleotide synthase [Pseudomonadota bacterium]